MKVFLILVLVVCLAFFVKAKARRFFDFKSSKFSLSKVIGSEIIYDRFTIRYCGQSDNYKYVFLITEKVSGRNKSYTYYLSNYNVFRLGDFQYKLVVLGSGFSFKEYKEKI